VFDQKHMKWRKIGKIKKCEFYLLTQ
jgi:hypothetical protein